MFQTFYMIRDASSALVCNKYFTSDTFFSRTLLPIIYEFWQRKEC